MEYRYALDVAVMLWVAIGAVFLISRAATYYGRRHAHHHGR